MEYDNFKNIKEKIEELESRIDSLENPVEEG
jgi:archaellum component FlaC